MQISGDGGEIERRLAGEIGDAEAAAEIEKAQGCRGVLGQPLCQRIALLLGLDDGLALEVLRAGEQMKAFEGERCGLDFLQQPGHLFGIDAELLGAAAHFHARGLELEIGIHAYRHACRQPQTLLDVGQERHFAEGFDIDEDAGGHRLGKLALRFAGAGKADVLRLGAGIQGHQQLAAGGDIDAIDQAGHVRHQGRHGVGLHGVVQLHGGRQGGAQRGHARAEQAAVIGVVGRLADAGAEPR